MSIETPLSPFSRFFKGGLSEKMEADLKTLAGSKEIAEHIRTTRLNEENAKRESEKQALIEAEKAAALEIKITRKIEGDLFLNMCLGSNYSEIKKRIATQLLKKKLPTQISLSDAKIYSIDHDTGETYRRGFRSAPWKPKYDSDGKRANTVRVSSIRLIDIKSKQCVAEFEFEHLNADNTSSLRGPHILSEIRLSDSIKDEMAIESLLALL